MMDIKPLFKALADESRIRILALIGAKGLSVEEIASAVGLTSATVSHHLAKLREAGLVEAERESYYTIYRFRRQPLFDALHLLAEDSEPVEDSADLDRYDQQVLSNYLVAGKLTAIPAQRKKRQVILRFLARLFAPGRLYSEKEVNLLIAEYHDDFATLRRELIMARLLSRKDSMYWRTEEPALPSGSAL